MQLQWQGVVCFAKLQNPSAYSVCTEVAQQQHLFSVYLLRMMYRIGDFVRLMPELQPSAYGMRYGREDYWLETYLFRWNGNYAYHMMNVQHVRTTHEPLNNHIHRCIEIDINRTTDFKEIVSDCQHKKIRHLHHEIISFQICTLAIVELSFSLASKFSIQIIYLSH